MTGCYCIGPQLGSPYCPCMMKRLDGHQLDDLIRVSKLIDTPETDQFTEGVIREAAHQRARWGSEHDAGKTPADWFWLIGYLAQKAMMAQLAGDGVKALHHCVSTAAALSNWHDAISGVSNYMRPGILPPDDRL